MKFFSLHNHSTYSFLDGMGKPEQVLERLTDISQSGIALTDHGNIFAHVPFTKKFKTAGRHLVYGVEAYIVNEIKSERGYYHITLLAKNNEGYQNLLKLVNISYKQFYYKPRITMQQLLENNKGLIILSGCFSDGYLIKNPEPDQQKVFEAWIQAFDKCEWYLELQPFTDMQEHWDRLTSFAKMYGVPCVITVDSHYPRPEDKATQDFMLAINTNKNIDDVDRLKMDFPLHIPTAAEVLERCEAMGSFKEEWITNSALIAESTDVQLPKTAMIKLNTTIDVIGQQCQKAMEAKGFLDNQTYVERLKYELKLIAEKDFMDYFAIIADMMHWAKQRMLVGAGRGSSAGSLVCYLLGITEVDPIKFGLLFERFIDINRKDLPDIDLDFPDDQRDSVINYLVTKYGEANTAQLITYNTFRPKAIIQDAARVLKIPIWETKEATSQIIDRSGGDSRAEFCLMDSIQQYEKLRNLFAKHPKLNDAVGLEGQTRQIGKHAAAVVISKDPLATIGSINETGVFGIDKYNVEDYGLLKIDVLGLTTLSILQDVCKAVNYPWQELYDIPLDDKLTFERVFTPAKLIGIFQFEGLSVQGVCRDISPTTFEHLVHITALGRPGTLNSGSTKEYIDRFKGKPYTLDPMLESYTKETLGIIVYQEQVMNVVHNIGKFSWDDTTSIRKAMSKNLGEEYFNKFKDKFISGAAQDGIDKESAIRIWEACYTHGSWCISGDTQIKLPTANQFTSKIITIKELYENGGRPKICKCWPTKKNFAKILSLNLDNGIVKPQQLIEVFYNGKKPIYKVETIGQSIKTTKEHHFLTKEGWKQLKDLRAGDEVAIVGNSISEVRKNRNRGRGAHNHHYKDTWRTIEYEVNRIKVFEKQKGKCHACKTELTINNWETHHKDENKSNNKIKNLIALCRKCHKSKHDASWPWQRGCNVGYTKIISIEYSGVEDVYDISMPAPYHNYVANDFIVHNSFNKSHAVSYALLSYWTGYFKAHWPEHFYARILRNEIDELKIKSVLKESGLPVMPLDLNLSRKYFTAQELEDSNSDAKVKTLVGGFTNIKGIGESAAERIERGQPYANREDFFSRIPDGVAKKIESALTTGLVWADARSMQEIVSEELGKITLTGPARSFTDIYSNRLKESVLLGRVMLVNLKDHNEVEKVQKRGYKMQGYTEYIVLKILDNDDYIGHICFDKKYTQGNKQTLLGLAGKICLFKVRAITGGKGVEGSFMLLGQKVKVLR